MRRALLGAAVVCALGACDTDAPRDRTERASRREELSPDATPPRVAILATRPGASESALFLARAGEPVAPAPSARFSHAPDGEVRGVLLPSGGVAVVADMERRRDPSFGAWLLLVEPGRDPRVLAKGCVHASRPLLLPSGRVLVQRGVAGAEPDPESGALRSDSLSLDEVDPVSGALRGVHAFEGYVTHLAGSFDGEAFVYRVRHGSADLIALGVESGAVRVLADGIPALARDFSVEPSSRSLVYANHDDAGWVVERLALDSGARTVVSRAEGIWVTPSVWPGGGVLVNDGRGGVVREGSGPQRPLGPGFDELRAVSADRRWVALLHRIPSSFSEPFVTDAEGTRVLRVPGPEGARLEIAGVLP